jgi:hypothetical protein
LLLRFAKAQGAHVAVMGSIVVCLLLLAGCSTSPKSSVTSEKATTTTSTGGAETPTTQNSSTTTTHPPTPALYAATYTDAPRGQPGYALVVNPGSDGAFGGLAVFEYQDGKEVAFFSFDGTASSGTPFTLNIRGDPAATTAQAEVTSSVITIQNCAQIFAPAVPERADAENSPPAPTSCDFSYKLAPGAARPSSGTPENLTASPDIKTGLLDAFLFENGWQAEYSAYISLGRGTTYVAYDPITAVNWAYASFDYNGGGPDPDGSESPGVGMQDGGSLGYFYQIPVQGGSSSTDDGWVMVGIGGEPVCFSHSVIPSDVISLWGLSDNPSCNG